MPEPRFEDFAEVELDEVLQSIRGWTSPNERKWNKWYARELYSGQGALVELGSLYGSMLLSIVHGLLENASPAARARKVHAYDLFLHPPLSDRLLPGARVGESSMETFLDNVRPWLDRIEIHAGDVTKLGWSNGPIEYLFVDVLKDLSVAQCVSRDFFTQLIPGTSLLVHQDFKHHHTWWIHLMMHRLREQLVPVFDLPDSASVVFRSERAVCEADCAAACDFAELGLDELERAFAYSQEIVSTHPDDLRRFRVRAAKVIGLLALARGEIGAVAPERALEAARAEYAGMPEAFREEYEYADFTKRVEAELR